MQCTMKCDLGAKQIQRRFRIGQGCALVFAALRQGWPARSLQSLCKPQFLLVSLPPAGGVRLLAVDAEIDGIVLADVRDSGAASGGDFGVGSGTGRRGRPGGRGCCRRCSRCLALPCAYGVSRFPWVGLPLAAYSILVTSVATLTDACPPVRCSFESAAGTQCSRVLEGRAFTEPRDAAGFVGARVRRALLRCDDRGRYLDVAQFEGVGGAGWAWLRWKQRVWNGGGSGREC